MKIRTSEYGISKDAAARGSNRRTRPLQWRKRYAKLESADPDLPRTRKAIGDAPYVWWIMLVVDGVWIGIRFLISR